PSIRTSTCKFRGRDRDGVTRIHGLANRGRSGGIPRRATGGGEHDPISCGSISYAGRGVHMTVVIVTGCSTGIGLRTAVAFAGNGDTVVATMRNTAKANGLRKAAADAGVEVEVVALDVTSDASARSAVADVLGRHGRIDVLVNNAGVGLSGPVEDFPEDQARAAMETNFWGPVRLARLVLPAMRAHGSGVIVNMSSMTGRLPA